MAIFSKSKFLLSNFNSFLYSTPFNCATSSKKFGSYNFTKNLEEGLKIAKLESKPIMMIVHKSFCGACRVLIPKLAASNEIKKLSKNFVMVNAFNGNEPNTKLYAPDGAYVPRIIFMRSDGVILKKVINFSITGDEFKYFYQNSEDVEKSMRLALKLNASK